MRDQAARTPSDTLRAPVFPALGIGLNTNDSHRLAEDVGGPHGAGLHRKARHRDQ